MRYEAKTADGLRSCMFEAPDDLTALVTADKIADAFEADLAVIRGRKYVQIVRSKPVPCADATGFPF